MQKKKSNPKRIKVQINPNIYLTNLPLKNKSKIKLMERIKREDSKS